MKKVKIIILGCIAFLVMLAIFLFINRSDSKPAGLKINTSPVATIYVNGSFVGKTPYSGTNPPGQISLKLIPNQENGDKLLAYETKVNLVSGIQTVIDREFGVTEETSAGDVISFDKIGRNSTGLLAVSSPDGSQIVIDGVSGGFTPFNSTSISPGSHKITIKKEGYQDKTLTLKVVLGLRLTLFVKLAKANPKVDLPTPTPSSQVSKIYVTIKDTPTGFLRMRTEPGKLGEEIAELKPGQKYLFLDRDATASGWYKIQYQDPAPGLPNGITGWVSNLYSSLSTPSGTLVESTN